MSSLFERKKIVPRYKIIAYIMVLLGVAIIAKATYIATAKRDYWTKVADRFKRDSVDVKPVRGNILSCNGELLASSLPEFKLFMPKNSRETSRKVVSTRVSTGRYGNVVSATTHIWR